ncbi:MAG: hypothetical protein J0M29_20310 [Chitinophagales bacterium]|nr:hypothetical protein [Chitinophagales bacterium]
MKKIPFNEVVVQAGADKKLLSPQQKEFNRLTKKIAQMREDIKALSALGERVRQRAAAELGPLLSKHQAHRAEMVRLLDRMYRTYSFAKTENKKLRHIISEMSFELADEGFDDLKEIYNAHNPDQDYESANAEADEVTEAMMREMASMMFGIEVEDDVDLDSPEKFQQYLEQKLLEKEQEAERRINDAKARRAEKPKSEKQLKAEAKRKAEEEKRKAEEKKISQSVREVYMDLVKAFHPDREPDEAEKVRKTAILQRVTAAYEANDFLALLQLQMELERIDANHLDGLADDKLRYFNKNLKSQLADLSEELWSIEAALAQMANKGPFDFFEPHMVERELEQSIKKIKKEIKSIQQDMAILSDPANLKAWLKQYRV